MVPIIIWVVKRDSPVVSAIAKQALALIKVDYKVLPHVIDVMDAMKPGAPILHDGMMTEGVNPPATKASNIAKRIEFKKGDAAAGFAQAEIVVEHDAVAFESEPVVEPESAMTPPSVSTLPLTVIVRVVLVALDAVPSVIAPLPRFRALLPVKVKSAFSATVLLVVRIRLPKLLSSVAPAPLKVSVPVPSAVGLPSCSVP